MKIYRALTFVPLLLTLTSFDGVVFAQPLEEVQIDLLFFRHNTTTQEQIDNIMSVPSRAEEFIREGVVPFGLTTPATVATTNKIRISSPNTITLKEQLVKIDESTAFDFLHQISWRQPFYTPGEAVYISLAPQKRSGLLQAVATVSFARYFQLLIELLYDPYLNNLESVEQETPHNRPLFISMEETLTDNILYYLDHPLIGVIVKITVLKEDAKHE